MDTKERDISIVIWVAMAALCLPGCSPTMATALPPTLVPTRPPTDPVPSLSTIGPPTLPRSTAATAQPIRALSLGKGDFYFTAGGAPSFLFSRNLAGYQIEQYERLLGLTRRGGSQLVRVQLDSMGAGYTKDGELDETWMRNWEQVLERAAVDGIQVIPVFTGWFDWNDGNPDYGYSTWKSNPLNAANGGPAATPAELFQPDSATQTRILQWMKNIAARWQSRTNIAAWEIFSEVNLATGATESLGVEFVNKAAAQIRAVDSGRRPVTASLAEIGGWSSFYASEAIDFIDLHPYPSSGQLDTFIIEAVRQYRARYNKPVLIGESGLSAVPPDAAETLTTAKNARMGIQHAIWAAMVSGAMNGRMLYWEDSFAIFFPALDWRFVEKNADAELPAVRFAQGLDFSGFEPLATFATAQITGAAVGNEKAAIGWFRDAGCEPPDWNLRPVIAGQTVTLAVPGSSSIWRIEFYDTKAGTTIGDPRIVAKEGNQVVIALPDFTDDIAFKMQAQSGVTGAPTTPLPPSKTPGSTSGGPLTTTDRIAGKWTGTIMNETSGFSTRIELFIQAGCKSGDSCGTVSAPELPCSGNIILDEINEDGFSFVERNMNGGSACVSGGKETLRLQEDGTLAFAFRYASPSGESTNSRGNLRRP